MHDERDPGDRRPESGSDGADTPAAAAEAWPSEPRPDETETSEWRVPERVAEPPPSSAEAYPAPDQASTGGLTAHAVPSAESATGDTTRCPRCGTENRPGLAFCRSCGQRLASTVAAVERPGTPEGAMACPRCGTHNRTGVAFCQNCGANLRGVGAGYVAPSAPGEDVRRDGRAVLGPIVLLIGLVGLVTGYFLPFAYGSTSLWERAAGPGGYGPAFWAGYPDVTGGIADQAYFGIAAPLPILGLVLVGLVVAGFTRATPRALQLVGIVVALVWAIGLVALFVLVELAGNWGGDLVGLLRELSPAGIIFFLASLIVIIGSLTRLGRS